MSVRLQSVAILAALVSGQALAQDDWYFGTGMGQSTLNFDSSGYLDEYIETNGYQDQELVIKAMNSGVRLTKDSMTTGPGFQKVYLGYQINPRWSVEVSYFRLGKFEVAAEIPSFEGAAAGTGPVIVDGVPRIVTASVSGRGEAQAEATLDVSGFALTGVARFPITKRVTVYGSMGLAKAEAVYEDRLSYDYAYSWSYKDSTGIDLADAGAGKDSLATAKSMTGIVPVLGVGLCVALTRTAGLRLGFERYGHPGNGVHVDSVWAGLTYRFGGK